MSFILIQNPGELPIWGMRLMGLSNKNADQIGQFGTGLKESIALLARMGQKMVIFSGTTRIDFDVQMFDEQREVCFKMSEKRGRFVADEWHGLGIHPNFGQADWDDPWMIFRELICNAMDEGGKDNMYHDVVSTAPEGRAGATRIYVEASGPLLAAYGTIGDRLLMLGDYKTLSTYDEDVQTSEKRRDPQLQIFNRDVWVQDDLRRSLYDYNIKKLKLNESRTADWYDINAAVCKAMVNWPVEQAQALLKAIVVDKESSEKLYEASVLSSAHYYANAVECKAWVTAFHNIWGETAVMTDNDAFYYDRLREVGFTPVVITDSGLRAMLCACGVRQAADVLTSEQRNYETLIQPNGQQQAVFDGVWDRLQAADLTNGKDKPDLMIFKSRSGGDTVVFGSYNNGVCHINMDCSGSVQERRACLEEIAHHVTGAADFTRDFQMYLVEALDAIMFQEVKG